MALNFRVARYKHGQLVTCKRTLALDYLKGYFTIDLLSGGFRWSRPQAGAVWLCSCPANMPRSMKQCSELGPDAPAPCNGT